MHQYRANLFPTCAQGEDVLKEKGQTDGTGLGDMGRATDVEPEAPTTLTTVEVSHLTHTVMSS